MMRKIMCARRRQDEFFKESLRMARCLRVCDTAPAMHNTEFPEGGSLTNSRMGEIPLETRASSPRGTPPSRRQPSARASRHAGRHGSRKERTPNDAADHQPGSDRRPDRVGGDRPRGLAGGWSRKAPRQVLEEGEGSREAPDE